MSEFFRNRGPHLWRRCSLPRHGHMRQACRTGVTLAASVPDGQQRFLLMAVILDVGTKPLQRHVPTRRNLLEIIAEFCELLRLNLPQAVSPDAVTAHETNILSYS